MIRQEGVHPLVHSHPHFSHTKWSNLQTRTGWKGNCCNDITLQFIEGKQASILSGIEEGRAPGENGLVCGISESQCWVKNVSCFPSDVVFIMSTSVLPISRWGGNWSVRPLGALRVYDFSCCCHCPGLYWFVEHSFLQKADSWSGGHGKKNNAGIIANQAVTHVHRWKNKVYCKTGDESSASANDLRMIWCTLALDTAWLWRQALTNIWFVFQSHAVSETKQIRPGYADSISVSCCQHRRDTFNTSEELYNISNIISR